ncbi:hypothetical protein KUTeg_017500 [Tegillarca granosa]|uniref:Uncharacterized protein n=1 Tax=Tegillarca granosa TaxID=220873 RepID=A0ABQ9EIZ7_TEGGR|nr:hypothetical protein KUTeg_017500 [Tegillarca granosa]
MVFCRFFRYSEGLMASLLRLALVGFTFTGDCFTEMKFSRTKRSDVELLCNSINVEARRIDASRFNLTIWYSKDIDVINDSFFPVRFFITLMDSKTSESGVKLRTQYLTRRRGLLSYIYHTEMNETTSYYLKIKPKCGIMHYETPDPCDFTCTTIQIALIVRKVTSSTTTTHFKNLTTTLQILTERVENINGTALGNNSLDKVIPVVLPLVIAVVVVFVGCFTVLVCIVCIRRRCGSTRTDGSQMENITTEEPRYEAIINRQKKEYSTYFV